MSSDAVDVDELGRRAAAAVRDRAGHVACRSGHPAPPPVWRLRPVAKRLLAVAAAVAVAGGVVGFASTVLAGRPPGLSVQPLAPPSGEVDQSALQRSPILDELDAAEEVLDVSIWGHENPSNRTIRVACEHLTQARDLATDPGTPLDAHLRNRIRNLRAYTCEDPDPSATEIHDQLKQLHSDVADQVR